MKFAPGYTVKQNIAGCIIVFYVGLLAALGVYEVVRDWNSWRPILIAVAFLVGIIGPPWWAVCQFNRNY